jgi:hypothetical protein
MRKVPYQRNCEKFHLAIDRSGPKITKADLEKASPFCPYGERFTSKVFTAIADISGDDRLGGMVPEADITVTQNHCLNTHLFL